MQHPGESDPWWRQAVLPGLLGGLAAAVLGYLAAFVATIGNESAFERAVSEAAVLPIVPLGADEEQVADIMAQLGLPFDFPTWKVAGLSWSDAHNVGSTYTSDGQVVQSSSDLAVPGEAWLLAVPVVLLLLAGFLVARRRRVATPREGARNGATIVVGYAIASVGIVVLSSISLSFGSGAQSVAAAIGPSLPLALFVIGLVYPVLFGALGGIGAAVLGNPT